MTATNAEGVPLVQMAERRDELQRCLEVIGWSWQKWADRTGVKLPNALAQKACKRAVFDSDIRWVQMLAAAVASYPRPVPADDAVDPSHPVAQLEPAKVVREVRIGAEQAPAGVPARSEEFAVPVSIGTMEALAAMAELYRDAGASEGAGDEEQQAVRWAMGMLAAKLGIEAPLRSLVSSGGRVVMQPAPVPSEPVLPQQHAEAPVPAYPPAIGQREGFADDLAPF